MVTVEAVGVGAAARSRDVASWLVRAAIVGRDAAGVGCVVVATATAYLRKPHGRPTVSEVAAVMDASARTVRRAVPALESLGLVKVSPGGPWREKRLTLLIDAGNPSMSGQPWQNAS